jgi:kexin
MNGKRSKRTKELYDAFGEGSSQDEEGDDNEAFLTAPNEVGHGGQYRDDDGEDSTDQRFAIDDEDMDSKRQDTTLFDVSREEGEGDSSEERLRRKEAL